MCLRGCFQKRVESERVDWVNDIALSYVGGHRSPTEPLSRTVSGERVNSFFLLELGPWFSPVLRLQHSWSLALCSVTACAIGSPGPQAFRNGLELHDWLPGPLAYRQQLVEFSPHNCVSQFLIVNLCLSSIYLSIISYWFYYLENPNRITCNWCIVWCTVIALWLFLHSPVFSFHHSLINGNLTL